MVVAQKLKDGEMTEQESLRLTGNLLRIAIFNISYIRGIFPEKYFNEKSIPPLDMKIKKLMPMDAESRRLVDWMEKGVYDAFQRKYLKTLMFCICETVDVPMIEEYALCFSYPDTDSQDFMMNINRTADITPNQIMLSTLVQLMRALDKIPDERTIVMKLLYYDDVTPQDYGPPFFRGCTEDKAQYVWTKNPLRMEIGNVNSKHLVLTLKVKSLCEDENDDMQDDGKSIGSDSVHDDQPSDSDSEISQTQENQFIVAPVEKQDGELDEDDNTHDPVENEHPLARVKDWINSRHHDNLELTDFLANFPDISIVLSEEIMEQLEKEGVISKTGKDTYIKNKDKGKQGIVRQLYRGIIFLYDESEEENDGYFCCKSQSCEKVKLFTEEFNVKTGGFDAYGFGDSVSSPKSLVSPEKEWQPSERYRNSNQGDKGSMYSIGQKLRIRVGPLKGYLCRVIGLRYSDVTVELDSQHKIFTVKSEYLAEVRNRNALLRTRFVYSKVAEEISELLLSYLSCDPRRATQLSCFETDSRKKRRIFLDANCVLCEHSKDIIDSLPVLNSTDYFLKPSMNELVERVIENPDYCSRVSDFTIGRIGYGYIKFLGDTDVRRLDLDQIVKFQRHEVVVYDDESSKPVVGEGLNKAAEVTLVLNVPNLTWGKEQVLAYKLKQSTERQGATFISFDPHAGLWKFLVPHFSRFGFTDDEAKDNGHRSGTKRKRKEKQEKKRKKKQKVERKQQVEERKQQVEERKKGPTDIWWDYESSPIPHDFFAGEFYRKFVKNMRDEGFTGRINLTVVAGYTDSIPKDVVAELSSCMGNDICFTIIYASQFERPKDEKTANNQHADNKIDRLIENWINQGHSPQNAMIIASDNGYTESFKELANAGHTTILVYRAIEGIEGTSGEIREVVDLTWEWRRMLSIHQQKPQNKVMRNAVRSASRLERFKEAKALKKAMKSPAARLAEEALKKKKNRIKNKKKNEKKKKKKSSARQDSPL